jgi:hypothetical protein
MQIYKWMNYTDNNLLNFLFFTPVSVISVEYICLPIPSQSWGTICLKLNLHLKHCFFSKSNFLKEKAVAIYLCILTEESHLCPSV